MKHLYKIPGGSTLRSGILKFVQYTSGGYWVEDIVTKFVPEHFWWVEDIVISLYSSVFDRGHW